MTPTMKKLPALWIGTLLLMFVLLLSGCAGDSVGDVPADSSSDPDSQVVSTDDGSEDPDAQLDFRKYNAYLEVVNHIYEMDNMLSVYFTVVQDQPEFALVDGMDYGMLEEISYSVAWKADMETAMDYNEEEPSYPDQDALLLALDQPYHDMSDILMELENYLSFDYLEDNMARAAELHAQLYAAVAPFDEAAWPFVDAMDILDQETEQLELDRLQAEGLDIAFYSRTVLNLCSEIDGDAWDQIMASETLPVLDMTNMESLYTQYQEAYHSLTAALDDPDQVDKVYNWNSGEAWTMSLQDNYVSAVDSLNSALAAFMDAARSQSDYVQSYEAFYTALSVLIEQYNMSIT